MSTPSRSQTNREAANQPDFVEQFAAPPEPRLFSFWGIAFLAVCFAIFVFILGFGLDWSLLHDKDSIRRTLEFSDASSAVICGLVFLLLLRSYRQRRAMLRQRVEVIANMNHHVRNALQVIEFTSYSNSDKEQFEAVKSSVNRIQWALRELLPKI